MPRFLIEVPHENRKDACDRAVRVFMQTGSHFLTNADWGCSDEVHKAWFVVELDSKQEAIAILPPLYRKDAVVTTLQKFTMQDIDEMRDLHRP